MRYSTRVGRLEKFYSCNQEGEELKKLSDEELETRIEEIAEELGYIPLKTEGAPLGKRGHSKRDLKTYIPAGDSLDRLSNDEISELVEHHLLVNGFIKK